MRRIRATACRKPRRRRAFVFYDAVIGIGLLGVVAATLIRAKSGVIRFEKAQADQRVAVQVAEQYLLEHSVAPTTQLAPTTQAASPESIRVEDQSTPAPAGWKWVRVEAEVNKHHGSLVGLVRSAP